MPDLGQSCHDLAKMDEPDETKIVNVLRDRFNHGQIYTRIGDSVLVALNPGQAQVAASHDAYVTEYKVAASDHDPEPPHIFQLTNQAYLHMRRTGIDQSIVLSGETNSGKSACCRLIVEHLLELRTTKLRKRICNAQAVLEAFGHAGTTQNSNASRFGKFVEVHFNEYGRVVGAKFVNYLLQKRLVARRPIAQERNFHIFYHLLSIDDEVEKTALCLDDVTLSEFLGTNQSLEDGVEQRKQLRSAFKSLGMREYWVPIMRLLACIVNLRSLQFEDGSRKQEAVRVKNAEKLDKAAEVLGIDPIELEKSLTSRTILIKQDRVDKILTVQQAGAQRDELVISLYSLLFSWIVDRVNDKVCNSDPHNFIGILDLPGVRPNSPASFDDFCANFASERMHQYMLNQIYKVDLGEYMQDGLPVSEMDFYDNLACVKLFNDGRHSLISTVNRCCTSSKPKDDANIMQDFVKYNDAHASFTQKKADPGKHLFTIQHFSRKVTYSTDGFMEQNKDILDTAFVSLMLHSYNPFIVELFNNKNINTESHEKDVNAIMNAQQISMPGRGPSMRRSKSRRDKNAIDNAKDKAPVDEKGKSAKVSTVLSQLESSLNDLHTTLDETVPWFVICLRSGDVSVQIQALHLGQLARRMKFSYTSSLYHDEFTQRYANILAEVMDINCEPKQQCEKALEIFGWNDSAAVGDSKIFLSEGVWRKLEDQLRASEKAEEKRLKEDRPHETANLAPAMGMHRDISQDALSQFSNDSNTDLLSHPHVDHSDRRGHNAAAAAAAGLPMPGMLRDGAYSDRQSFASEDDYEYPEYDSRTNSEVGNMETKRMLPGKADTEYEEPEAEKPTGVRRHWLNFVWVMTWWIPSKCLVWCGRMKRRDIRVAWREKVTLCMIIFFMAAFMIWFLVFFGRIVCPHQDVFSQSELQAHGDKNNAYIAIRGEVFDLTKFAPHHWASEVIPASAILTYAGTDATNLFPVQVSSLCQGVDGTVPDAVSLDFNVNLTDPNAKYHDFRSSSGDYRPDWYFEKMMYLRKNYKLGTMGFSPDDIQSQATSSVDLNGIKTNRAWAILNKNVYDMTFYLMGGRHMQAPPGQAAPPDGNSVNFMSDSVVNLFRQKSGQDITEYWNALPLAADVKQRQEVCLRNLFYVGSVDERNSPRCIFSTYLLLIVTVFLCLVIVFKFLSALQFRTRREPEELDKFIVCQVPCYTEDEESLRKTIDSIAVLKYDDKRKLLFIICDGMIVGGGNDRPTPRIVLDILGVDPNVDPPALSFLSIGEGQKQHNMAKIYSGLYECHGHVVPYIVVVKVGKPSERQRPGNRGKRDSQLVLMRFLNKVHFNAPMLPMELEIYHQIQNVIGVNPSFYEFVLMVDADTEVMPDGLNRMVSVLVHDSKIIGLCGETMLSNEKDTWVTMIQVYEYFISHYLIKAFESLFGTVTCLPGCFCIYRVRSPQNQPLLISNQIIDDYSVCKVDTLHMKNLLHLGEDRYLTTLILKHFPKYKTKFIVDATCRTNGPDQWSILLSQRRRWINSTIHNLGELVFLPQLCGFCCFSMRFVVMLDLISTLVQPAIVGYLVFLIYSLATSTSTVPIMSIITIAGVYGLQAIIFILHRKWEYIIWMLVSILAIPVFSFLIPLYSYWHFDDFSWGNTRVVLGEKGKKVIVPADEGHFDPKSIPTMTWEEHEQGFYEEDWNENQSVISKGTARTGMSQSSYYSRASHHSQAAGRASQLSHYGPDPFANPGNQYAGDGRTSHASFLAPMGHIGPYGNYNPDSHGSQLGFPAQDPRYSQGNMIPMTNMMPGQPTYPHSQENNYFSSHP